jgi:hypothetical protein
MAMATAKAVLNSKVAVVVAKVTMTAATGAATTTARRIATPSAKSAAS